MNTTRDPIVKGLTQLYEQYDGLVVGGNDFLYTNQLEEHPCSYFIYCYGFLLQSLGVDTIFLENHYINEPIQTRGFLGNIMYYAYLFGFRVIGIELKGSPEVYHKYTNKVVKERKSTVAYDEKSRLIQLNHITKDIVDWQMDPSHWTSEPINSMLPVRRKGKWMLFCGMSHVNDEKYCKGLKTLLRVPGLGLNIGKLQTITKGKAFKDTDSSYTKPTDYLIEMIIHPKKSIRSHIDTTIFTTLYEFMFFYKAYQTMMNHFDRETSVGQLWSHLKKHAYPKTYQDMLKYMIQVEPILQGIDYDFIGSIVYSLMKDICSRKMVQNAMASMAREDMSDLADQMVIFMERKSGVKFNPEHYPYLMDMLFLEKKTMPEENAPRLFLSEVKKKFQKQLTRPENHLYHLFFIMNSLHKDNDKKVGFVLPAIPSVSQMFEPIVSPVDKDRKKK